MAVTFDGENQLIILDTSSEVDVKEDLYSAWKDWARTGNNSRYQFAFDQSVAGDDIDGAGKSVAPYFFLRNDYGWRIRPPEADAEIRFIGNLFRRAPLQKMFVPTLGAFTVSLELEISPQALVLDAVTEALVQRAIDLMEADETFTPTSIEKFHRITKASLLQKDVSGGSLDGTIVVDE